MNKNSFCSKKIIIICLVVLIAIIATAGTLFFMYIKNDTRTRAQIIIKEERASHKRDTSWDELFTEEIYTENEILFAVMFYNTEKTEHYIAIYKKGNCKYSNQFLHGRKYKNSQDKVWAAKTAGFTVIFSLNQEVNYDDESNEEIINNILTMEPFILITE